MILVACLTAPAPAQQVGGAEKAAFAGIFGWWLPAASPHARPAVVALHGCGGLYGRGRDLNERHRAMAQLLGARGCHVLFPDSLTPRGLRELCTLPLANRPLRAADRRFDIQAAIEWLMERPQVDRARIAILGWSHGGGAVLSTLSHPTRARAAVAFYPGCSTFARGRYSPSAPLLILIGALDDWTPPAPCVELGKRSAGVTVRVLADSYHDFDHPSARVRVRNDVPGGVNPGAGVTVGANPRARARRRTRRCLNSWSASCADAA